MTEDEALIAELARVETWLKARALYESELRQVADAVGKARRTLARAGIAAEKMRVDVARMDWLSMHVVNVREPLLHGSRDMFWSSPDGDEETPEDQVGPSDLRACVDEALAAAEGGK